MRFGRLMWGENDKLLLAVEVFTLCQLLKLNFADVVIELCGHLELNSEEEQERLRELYNKKLAMQKAKRDAKKAEMNATEDDLDTKDIDEEE